MQETKDINFVEKALDFVWNQVVAGDGSWNPDTSCYALAEEYKISDKSIESCVENFIYWQALKTTGTGFVLGLPGVVFMGVTIPADLASATYLQLRMIAVIALLHGWDIKSDRVRTLAYLSLLGSGASEALRLAGVRAGTKFTAALLRNVPGAVLIAINKAVGFRLITKAGTTGVVNISKLIPIFGGLVSGGLNGFATRQIGNTAHYILKIGPNG
jgi:hypothetical protein